MNDLMVYLAERKQAVEERLSRYLDNQDIPKLAEAMKYAILNGGKRIRPILAIAVNEILEGYTDQIMPTACAIEMIHSYSLVHDDLPAMDDDDLRRGKPTLHKKYDEATAILAGDALQAYAYEILARESELAGVEPRNILKLIKELGKASGLQGMAGGQMLDLESSGKKISLSELQKIHNLKTGALLKFSILAPTYINDCTKEQRFALKSYAEALGLAFQIKDDILDVEGSIEDIGKTPGKDSKFGKATYVNILGLEKAKEYLKAETAKALTAVEIFGKRNYLELIAEYLLERKN